MYLLITGFFPEPNEDDSLQFKQAIQSGQESDVIKIMGWDNLDDAAGGESELTREQARKLMSLLGEPGKDGLIFFIGIRV
jgi:hypothetical protein